jgi:hypothetical protein
MSNSFLCDLSHRGRVETPTYAGLMSATAILIVVALVAMAVGDVFAVRLILKRRSRAGSAGAGKRQLDDLGADPAFADEHRRPGLGLPSHERERDRPEGGGDGDAAELPHDPLA